MAGAHGEPVRCLIVDEMEHIPAPCFNTGGAVPASAYSPAIFSGCDYVVPAGRYDLSKGIPADGIHAPLSVEVPIDTQEIAPGVQRVPSDMDNLIERVRRAHGR